MSEAVAFELAKGLLQLFFAFSRLAGLNDEEREKLFTQVNAEFDKRPASKLEDV